MEQEERPGVIANGRFYWFTRHFLERRITDEDHQKATDELIGYTLSEPDYVNSPEGDRIVYWKIIEELNEDNWWLKVIIIENTSGPAVLTAYRNSSRDP